MLVVFIAPKCFQVCTDFLCRKLPKLMRQRQHLVPAVLDRTCLVHADMTGICSNHTLVRLQKSIDPRSIGLGSSNQKIHLCIRRLAGLADLLLCRLREGIRSIARRCQKIGFL